MPKTQYPAVDPSLLALKPRQVLLSNPITMKKPSGGNPSSASLTPDQKPLLLQAVAHFLDCNGFSKTLKKFRSEAQLEKDGLKGSALGLEEIYLKYLEMWNLSNAEVNNQNKQDTKKDGTSESDEEDESTEAVETGSKKNNRSSEGYNYAVVNQPGAKGGISNSNNAKEILTNDAAPDLNISSKKTKKSKKISDSLGPGTDQCNTEISKGTAGIIVHESHMEEPDKKSKEKKKKKSKLDSKSLDNSVELPLLESLPGATEGKSKDIVTSEGQSVGGSDRERRSNDKKKKKDKPVSDSLDDVKQSGFQDKKGAVTTKFKDVECSRDAQANNSSATAEEKSVKSKGKKKKDGSVSNGLLGENLEDLEIGNVNGNHSKENDCETLDEDVKNNKKKSSKKRKRPASEENDIQSVDKKAAEEPKGRKFAGLQQSERSKQSAEVNASLGSDENAGKASSKHINGHANGSLEKSGEKPAFQNNKKQRIGSVEPKTVNAFQRVKAEEVIYTDDRLKDNSYWAKDGAESGYGAKAQEILGQVRGRDFRHEKTKKKRGTYRGGHIDLHSHSIKFNYSDDE